MLTSPPPPPSCAGFIPPRLTWPRPSLPHPISSEPLSGLDSAMSFQLTKTLKNLVQEEGMSILLSLHQPRPEVYKEFDEIGLMCAM